jgi:transcriptional regulator with XRE-family HTH domain
MTSEVKDDDPRDRYHRRVVIKNETRVFPALLRHWRTRRGMSQLDLGLAANVSARHVSFLETARAAPSREMVLRLGSTLQVPLRDQNVLLRAAGFADAWAEPEVGPGGLPKPILAAIERMLEKHEPYPMTVLDRGYNVTRSNRGGTALLSRFVAKPEKLAGGLNVFALIFDPDLARPFMVDWDRVAHSLVARLHREVLASPEDGTLASLLASLFRYPGVPESFRVPDFSVEDEPVLTLRLERGDVALSFLTTVTAFNAPQNVTLEELRLESYFPLDEATEAHCAALAKAN